MRRLIKIFTFTLVAAFVAMPSSAATVIAAKSTHGGKADIAIVFIHGLEGSAAESFENEDGVSWMDLLRADTRKLIETRKYSRSTADADIYLVDYSDVFTNASISVSIDEISRQVADALRSSPAFYEHKHVWIVAHSMGGLVAKKVLTIWEAADYDNLLSRIVGVSLIGVPSNGSPLADIADEIGDSNYGGFLIGWLGYNARNISDLRTSGSTNTYLSDLESSWANFMDRRSNTTGKFPRVHCSYETDAEFAVTRGWWRRDIRVEIVPKIYTLTSCDGEAKPINKTHSMLPKPIGVPDPSHELLILNMQDTFRVLQEEGQVFEELQTPGFLFREITRLIDGKSDFRDGAGYPAVYEDFEVDGGNLNQLRSLKLKDRTYKGAAWSDVFEEISELNPCVVVGVDEPKRKTVRVGLGEVESCKLNSDDHSVLVCDLQECP